MKNDTARRLTACLLAAVALTPGFRLLAVPPDPAPLPGLEEVSHAQVELHGGFWGPRLKAQHDVTVLAGRGTDDKQNQIALTAVPYYAWQNREKGAMNVWIQEAPRR
ncbi:MAG: hypothetical protein IH608_05880 [Proteobacteria bacterium]|nr:hypothetical protein [Pseudomonadota bacterium]